MRRDFGLCGFLMVVALVAMPGCCATFFPAALAPALVADADDEVDEDDMTAVSENYQSFLEDEGRAPRNLQEFLDYLDDEDSTAHEALSTGRVIFLFDAEQGPKPQEGTKTVLAYESQTPRDGGKVLLKDGEIRTVTAEEFRQLPQPMPAKGK